MAYWQVSALLPTKKLLLNFDMDNKYQEHHSLLSERLMKETPLQRLEQRLAWIWHRDFSPPWHKSRWIPCQSNTVHRDLTCRQKTTVNNDWVRRPFPSDATFSQATALSTYIEWFPSQHCFVYHNMLSLSFCPSLPHTIVQYAMSAKAW